MPAAGEQFAHADAVLPGQGGFTVTQGDVSHITGRLVAPDAQKLYVVPKTLERQFQRGEIELFLYLYKDSSYEIYPLQQTPDSRKYDLQGNAELTFDLPLTNFTIIVQKNGEALPDSINPSYTRGNVFFKSRESNNWQLEVRYDLGKTGDVYDFFSMKTGEYSVNFSVGYGLPFSFMQWVYLGCLEVNP